MRKLEKRAIICLTLAAVLFIGTGIFVFKFCHDGSSWASYPANDHIYSNGHLVSGTIYDCNGKILASNSKNGIQYNDDYEIRRSTVHVIGDEAGNISVGAESVFKSKLVGWNIVTGVYSPTNSGRKINLTIDADLSKTAYEALAGRNGLVAVYNYDTGDIMCLVSSPNFDPEDPPTVSSDDSSGIYMNKFFSASIVPGSIFKLVTSAAAIENVGDLSSFEYYCDGSLDSNGDKITCPYAHGKVDFEQALAVSCNGAFAQLTEKVGAANMKDYVKNLGLTTPMDINGIPTTPGSFNFESEGANLMWSGIGQYEDLINPCSMLTYVGAIAGGGQAAEPKIISSIKFPFGLPAGVYNTSNTDQLIEADTAAKLKKMMRNNVTSNYGESNFPGLDICAKSGTAEVGGDRAPNAWFTGFLDDSEHPYAFIVLVENGGSGANIAGAVANTVLQAAVGD